MQSETTTTGAKSIRTGTNGKNENRGCPSVFEGRGEGSQKIPVQNPTINPFKKIIPVQIHRKTIQKISVKNLRQKNVSKMYLKVEIWIR